MGGSRGKLRTAARWVARRREEQRRRRTGEGPIPPPRPVECPECRGRNAALAGDPRHVWHEACGGTGWITPLDPADGSDLPAQVIEEAGEFLRAWALIEKHGPVGALCLLGEERWDPWFVEALEMFDGFLAEAEEEFEAARPVNRKR